ncbi:sirohydrochlorin chelatase [Cytobacillus gottheilii]|uniref:sirohydrochlorin chelatase n=1 Tax=Cytobacillus gottheilii TaxID=859144 RepID=UPI002495462F|nr:sirohydrochlorin chelatase [Cytobacillus gottheilii]
MKAVLYIGHGSRNSSSNEEFHAFIQEVKPHINAAIQEVGFLENASPSISEAVAACVEKGASELFVMPVLLLAGIHGKEDIPKEIAKMKERYPHMLFRYGRELGADPLAAKILAERVQEKNFSEDNSKKALLLVGHGSRIKESERQLSELSNLLKAELNSQHVFPCFLKESSPGYQEKLHNVVESGYETIYTIPHLLFTGIFTKRMKEMAKGVSADVIHCEPLGFHSKLAELVVKRTKGELKH